MTNKRSLNKLTQEQDGGETVLSKIESYEESELLIEFDDFEKGTNGYGFSVKWKN